MSNEEEESDNIETVADPQDYIQNRRLQGIFDARDEIIERRLIAKEQLYQDELFSATIFRSALENYFSEIRPIFMETEAGKQIWYRTNFGSVSINLPVRRVENPAGRIVMRYESEEQTLNLELGEVPDAKTIQIFGLDAIFSLPDPLEANFSVSHGEDGFMGSQSDTVTETTQIPFKTLDQMLNTANRFLASQGIEVEIEEEKEPARI